MLVMLHLMCLQVLQCDKAHGAVRAHMRSLARVLSQVQCEVMLNLKALCAVLTAKWLLARMNLNVVLQRVLLLELAPTDTALKGPLARVHALVLLQIRLTRKLLLTVRALQRLRSVHYRVNLQIAQMLKLFRTELTRELLLIHTRTHAHLDLLHLLHLLLLRLRLSLRLLCQFVQRQHMRRVLARIECGQFR